MSSLVEYDDKLDSLIQEGHKLMIKLPSDKNRKMNDMLMMLVKAKQLLEEIAYD